MRLHIYDMQDTVECIIALYLSIHSNEHHYKQLNTFINRQFH